MIVQGTTDIRDAGLLEEVIEPGFHAAYPQFEIAYVPVGTGQALTNARAGQGDAVITHAPTSEAPFVEEGFSLEPRGRAIFYSDYVLVGPSADPAGVLAAAPHDAAAAFKAIARAGAEGRANFVSRGDGSGTNVEEKAIWKLTGVGLNSFGEPGEAGTKDDAPWYHRGGGGQAETVQLANQCPFAGGNCYDITDRGTFDRLVANGAVDGLMVVTEKNETSAPGGRNLLTNPFTIYVVNPAKVSTDVNVEGARALVAYLTSEVFRAGLDGFPNPAAPAFHADAHAALTASAAVVGTFAAGAPLTVSGTVANPLPGSPPVAGVPITLQRFQSLKPGEAPSYVTIAAGHTDADGGYSLTALAGRSGPLRILMPTTAAYPSFAAEPLLAVGALSETVLGVGEISVRSRVEVAAAEVKGRTVGLRGRVEPTRDRGPGARLAVLGRRQGERGWRALRRLRPGRASVYAVDLRLSSGKWKLRVRYRDPGAVVPATSRAVSASVH